MKQHTASLAISVLATTLALAPMMAQGEPSNSKTRLLIGSANLESDWGEHDHQGVIGVVSDFKASQWPLAIAVDVFGAGNEEKRNGSKSEAYIASLHLGGRLQWDASTHWIQPYLGAGVALANAETKPHKSDDSGVGYWLGVGADIPLGEHLSLGLDLRYSKVDVELDNPEFNDHSLNAGGSQLGMTLGYRW